jgi:transposase-like protein
VLGSDPGYSVSDVARYLQFAPESIIYWLRTGNLQGERHPVTGEWRVHPQNLVAFLRSHTQSVESAMQADITLVGRSNVADANATAPVSERVLVPAL